MGGAAGVGGGRSGRFSLSSDDVQLSMERARKMIILNATVGLKRLTKGGTPGGTRIPNLLIRSQTLYPIELRVLCAECGEGKSPVLMPVSRISARFVEKSLMLQGLGSLLADPPRLYSTSMQSP